MEIVKVLQTKNACYKRNRKANPIGILVHSTGAVNPELRRYVDAEERLGRNQYDNHWNKSTADKMVHAFIGYDKNKKVIVAEILPHDVACWGCGAGKKGSYNRDPVAHIQFEICEGSKTDEAYYKQAIECAEEYCAYLCKLYGWSADRITSHKEAYEAGYASNHGDPHRWMKNFGDDMDKFRSRVAARLNGTETPVESPAAKNEQIHDETPKTATNATGGAKTVNIELLTLRKGNENEQVKTVQRLLNAMGYESGKVDGKFGTNTRLAVRAFQQTEKLDVDGVVGKDTWTALLK